MQPAPGSERLVSACLGRKKQSKASAAWAELSSKGRGYDESALAAIAL